MSQLPPLGQLSLSLPEFPASRERANPQVCPN